MAVTVDELVVRIKADMSQLQKELKKIEGNVSKSTDKMQSSFRRLGATLAAVGGAALGVQFTRGIIQTGVAVDTLELKMNTLFGSVEDGAKAFDALDSFASKVPFSLAEISAGAGPLAVVANDVDDMNQLLQITGNIAALTGRPFNEMAGQIQRAMAGGINSAELLRDDGIKAMLGFEDGVTHSVAETVKRLQDGFGVGGEFDGIMDKMAKTASGAMSMVGDAFFQMQKAIFKAGVSDAVIKISAALRSFLQALTPILVQVAKFANVLASVLAPALQLLADNLQLVTIFLGLLLAKMVAVRIASLAGAAATAVYGAANAALAAHTALATTALTGAQKAIVLMIAGVKGLGVALATVGKILMRFLPFAVLAGLAYAVQLTIQFVKGAGSLSDALKLTKDVIVAFVDISIAKFDKFIKNIRKFGQGIKAFFASLMIQVTSFIRDGINKAIRGLNHVLESVKIKAIKELDREDMGVGGFENMRDNAQAAILGIDADISILDETIQGLNDKLFITMAAMKDAFAKGDMEEVEIKVQEISALKASLEDLDDGIEKLTPRMQVLHDAATSLGDGVTGAFRSMLDETRVTMADMGEMVKQIVKDMIAEIFRLAVVNQMMNAMFGGVTGYQSKPTMQLFGGGSAGGGAAYGNQPMLVGERGPELFVPHSAGRIMNNASSKGALGGGSTVVNQTINIETGVSQTVRAEMLSLLPVIKADTMNAVADQNRRGGSYRQALA
jgi:hypothetical protein